VRTGLIVPIALIILAFAAWSDEESSASLRVVMVESLALSSAELVIPAFSLAFDRQLAIEGRSASVELLRLDPARPVPQLGGAALTRADLVVSFGAVATEAVQTALLGSPTPHVFAFVPRGLAAAVMAANSGERSGRVAGIAGPLPRGAALAIAKELLSTRSGAPLRIGLVHPLIDGNTESTAALLSRAVELPYFVPVPFDPRPGPSGATPVSSMLSAVEDAVSRGESVDAFWLAVEVSEPLEAIVRAIEQRTGRPVVYAPSEAAVAAGALMSLAPEPRSTALEAAALAGRLMSGNAPLDMPVRTPHRVDFSLNLATAERLGMVPPYELVELARGRLFR
jgi:hypothetical protein